MSSERWTIGLPENFDVNAANALAGESSLPVDQFCYRPPVSLSGHYEIGVKSTAGNVPSAVNKIFKVYTKFSNPVEDNVRVGNFYKN